MKIYDDLLWKKSLIFQKIKLNANIIQNKTLKYSLRCSALCLEAFYLYRSDKLATFSTRKHDADDEQINFQPQVFGLKRVAFVLWRGGGVFIIMILHNIHESISLNLNFTGWIVSFFGGILLDQNLL